MGNRANAFIQTTKNPDETWQGIGIYAHWSGTKLHEAVIDALPIAQRRAGDVSYFTRIIMQNALNAVAEPTEETGAGVWLDFPDDNEHPILVVNAQTGRYWYADESGWRASQPVTLNGGD